GQGDQGHAHIDLAARTVDDAGGGDDFAARLLDRSDAFARRQTRGDDVLDHDDLLPRPDGEAATQFEFAALALDVHGADVQVLGRLIAGDDAADGGRDRRVDRPDRGDDLFGQRLAQALAAGAVHEDQVLLQEDRAVQAGRED